MYRNNFNYIQGIHTNDLTLGIAVYDVEEKKLVLLFSSGYVCTKYTKKTSLSIAIKNKVKSKNKLFKRIVCYRYANTQQMELLNGQPMLCFDERYRVDSPVKLVSEFRHEQRMQK